MQACVQRQASKVSANSHQICLAPDFGGEFWSLPALLSDFCCGSYWWLALVDRQSNAIHSWVTQVSERAQYPSLPRCESRSGFAEERRLPPSLVDQFEVGSWRRIH